jgi:hypothetical protein
MKYKCDNTLDNVDFSKIKPLKTRRGDRFVLQVRLTDWYWKLHMSGKGVKGVTVKVWEDWRRNKSEGERDQDNHWLINIWGKTPLEVIYRYRQMMKQRC